MLKPNEKLGLENLLNLMDLPDLYSLRDTVTKKMLSSTNRQETIEAILSCIKEPCDLLNRQKISRKLLFKYLQAEVGYVSPELSKSHLIVKCIEEWNKNNVSSQEMECVETSMETKIQPLETGYYESMALEFTKWFFPLYNELKEFDTTHFWPDIVLEFVAESGQHKIVGDGAVVAFLTNLIANQKFYFLPNNSPSALKCENEIHGMVRISVNGLLYRFNIPVGIFESLFGLVRNPAYDNNWKIKWLCLLIKQQHAV